MENPVSVIISVFICGAYHLCAFLYGHKVLNARQI